MPLTGDIDGPDRGQSSWAHPWGGGRGRQHRGKGSQRATIVALGSAGGGDERQGFPLQGLPHICGRRDRDGRAAATVRVLPMRRKNNECLSEHTSN